MGESMEFAELLATPVKVLHLVIADTNCFGQVSFRLELGMEAEFAVVIQIFIENVFCDGVVEFPLAADRIAFKQFVMLLDLTSQILLFDNLVL